MKFSIITASFNQGQFIGKCLTSVLTQGGGFAVEHIILDNCSNDSTADALDLYISACGSVDVRVFIEPDNGQSDAINRGFRLATGDIICWLNTDEWYEKDALMRVATYLSANPNIDVVFGDCDFVDSTGNLVKRKREYFFSESMLLYYGCYIPSCATFVRRKAIDDGIILRPEFKVTMDFDWYVHMVKAGYRFAHIPATLASFTWHDSNISSTFVERRLLERRLVQDHYSGVRGPRWLRSIFYAVMRMFWIGVRVARRTMN